MQCALRLAVILAASAICTPCLGQAAEGINLKYYYFMDENANFGYGHAPASAASSETIEVTMCTDSNVKRTFKRDQLTNVAGCSGSNDGSIAYVFPGLINEIGSTTVSAKVETVGGTKIVTLPKSDVAKWNDLKHGDKVVLFPKGALVGKTESVVTEAFKSFVKNPSTSATFEIRSYPRLN